MGKTSKNAEIAKKEPKQATMAREKEISQFREKTHKK